MGPLSEGMGQNSFAPAVDETQVPPRRCDDFSREEAAVVWSTAAHGKLQKLDVAGQSVRGKIGASAR